MSDITYVGLGGATRSVQAGFELGQGRWRVRQEFGLARAVWDLAYGYVSGFRKRDIAYYVTTRSLNATVCLLVHRWERRNTDQDTCGHRLLMQIGNRWVCAECPARVAREPWMDHPISKEWNQR